MRGLTPLFYFSHCSIAQKKYAIMRVMNGEHFSVEETIEEKSKAERGNEDMEQVRAFVEAAGVPYARVPAILERLTVLYRAGVPDTEREEGKESDGKRHSHFADEVEMANFARRVAEDLEHGNESAEDVEAWRTMTDILFLQDIGKAGLRGDTASEERAPDAPAVLYGVSNISGDPLKATIESVAEQDLGLKEEKEVDFQRSILVYLKRAERRYNEMVPETADGGRAPILRNAPADEVWDSFDEEAVDTLSDDRVKEIAKDVRMRFFWDAHSVHSEAILAQNKDECIAVLEERHGSSTEEAAALFETIRRGVGSHHRVEGISVVPDSELIDNPVSLRSACIDKLHAFLKRSKAAFELPPGEAWETACKDAEMRIGFGLDKDSELYAAYMKELTYLRDHAEIGNMLVRHVRASRAA